MNLKNCSYRFVFRVKIIDKFPNNPMGTNNMITEAGKMNPDWIPVFPKLFKTLKRYYLLIFKNTLTSMISAISVNI